MEKRVIFQDKEYYCIPKEIWEEFSNALSDTVTWTGGDRLNAVWRVMWRSRIVLNGKPAQKAFDVYVDWVNNRADEADADTKD